MTLYICIATPAANATDWHKMQTLRQTIFQEDRRRNFEGAVHAAEECMTITKATQDAVKITSGNYSCAYYLSSALRKGMGITRDEERAVDLLKALVAIDPNDDAALDLAEAYIDGSGTARDPVEAYVLVWRVEHGAWSSYSDHWGMCDDCNELWAREKAVDERIEQELTPEEKRQAATIAEARFPELAARVKHRQEEIATTIVALVAVAIGLLGWRTRSSRRSGRKPA
jgi:hypothetical protein